MTRAHIYRRHRIGARNQGAGGGRPLLFFLIAPIFAIGAVVIVGLVAAGASYYADVQSGMTSPEEVMASRGGGARIYDRNGLLLFEYLDEQYGYQEQIPLEKVSPHIQQATIAAEDASFYDNPGLNFRGLTRAFFENLRPGDEFFQGTGGSSITQQLVKQLYFTEEERSERSVSRKMREAVLALEITRDYEKHRILEWYLNEIPYGGVFRGIEAAAQGYFNVSASDVTLAQAAFLAGLPQSPGQYDPFANIEAARVRQHEVLDLMVKHDFISFVEANRAKAEEIRLNPKERPFLAPHFVLYVGDYIERTLGEHALYRGGLDVHTTLDFSLTLRMNAILEQHLQTYEHSTQGHNGSVVVIDPPTGQILAMVGSRDYYREDIDGEVNNAVALNSPGSALKPFTYATAFMQGWSPEWPIVDTPIRYTIPGSESFSPTNPDGRNRGVMPVKQALGNSFNIPAFKTILWTGVDSVIDTAKAMGITTLDRELGPSMTLGGVDVKLLDMVYAYSTFANNGRQVGVPSSLALPDGNRELDPIPVITATNRSGEVLIDNQEPQSVQAIGPEYAYMISDILSADANRSTTYGAGSNLNIPGWRVAVKTGTSEPYEKSRLIGDTWTIGYTPNIALGVWVGNSDNRPMVNIFSTTIAGRTWHDGMLAALEGRPQQDFQRPPGLVQATVCVPSGLTPRPGVSCPTVTGTFAAEALEKRNEHWWGGQFIGGINAGFEGRVPGEIFGWKRYLADEYLRTYRFFRAAERQQSDAPPAMNAPAANSPRPAEREDAGRNRGRGRGNGQGRGGN